MSIAFHSAIREQKSHDIKFPYDLAPATHKSWQQSQMLLLIRYHTIQRIRTLTLVKTRLPVKRTCLPTRCLSRQAGVNKEWCQRAEARRGRNFGHATSSTSRAVNRVYTLFHDIDGQRACRDNNTTTGCPDNRLGGRVLSVYNRQCHRELLPGLTRSLACFLCPARHYRRVRPDPLHGDSLC